MSDVSVLQKDKRTWTLALQSSHQLHPVIMSQPHLITHSIAHCTYLRQQPCLHWGHPLPPPLPAAWRTVAADPSSVALYGPAGSGIVAALLSACSVVAAEAPEFRLRYLHCCFQQHRSRQRWRKNWWWRWAVRWPLPGAWHCCRPVTGWQHCQGLRWLGMERQRGWFQGWGRQSCSE